MSGEPLRIIQDGARSMWVEGPIVLPHPPGLKAITLEDLLAKDARTVVYQAEKVGRVDDAELWGEADEQAWLQAELDKRSKYLDRLRAFAERKGLTFGSILAGMQSAVARGREHLGIKAVELVHTPTYRGTFDLDAALQFASPKGRAAILAAELEPVVDSLERLYHGNGRP